MDAILSQLTAFNAPGTSMLQMHEAPGIPKTAPLPAGAMGNGGLGDDEKPITQAFTMSKWADGTHECMMNGDLLFVARTRDTKSPNHSLIVPLHKLNEILRRGYGLNFVPSNLESAHSPSDADRVDTDLSTIDKDEQHMYARGSSLSDVSKEMESLRPSLLELKKQGALPSMAQVYAHQLQRDGQRDTTLLDEASENAQTKLHKLQVAMESVANDDVKREIESYRSTSTHNASYSQLLSLLFNNRNSHLRYASVQGILDMWNFLGVHILGSRGKMDSSGLSPSITARIRGIGPVLNIWDGARPWSKLYLVLVRTKAGYFQIIPWLSNEDEIPPAELMVHRDIMGHAARSHYWFIGHAQDDSRQKSDKAVKLRAAGVSANSLVLIPDALRAKGSLDTLVVQLRI